MFFSILLSIFFFVAAIYNITQGVFDEGAAGLAISFALAGLFFFDKYQKKQANIFLIWLMNHKEELKNDKTKTLMWKNNPVTFDSHVTRYQFCASFLIATFKHQTLFILDNSSNKLLINFLASFVTLIMGWWGIPWGPVATIQTLFLNLRGGTRESIREMITELENAEQEL